jgi:tetratricopeptide (TPR) repeat protein
MEYQEYQNRVNRGTQMFEAGNYQAALEIFQGLVMSDISDIDKARMSINVAVVYENLGIEREALQWYDRAIAFEKPHARFEAQEYKAVYLKEIGRLRDSLAVYESLLASPHLTEEDKMRIRSRGQELYNEIVKPQYRRPGTDQLE